MNLGKNTGKNSGKNLRKNSRNNSRKISEKNAGKSQGIKYLISGDPLCELLDGRCGSSILPLP